MDPSISFGGTNSGLQVGTNHGLINSQIHIQNITTIRPLATSIYKSLFSASDQFTQVRNELGLLISVLNATEEHTPEFRPGDPCIIELNDAVNGCRNVLQDLQRLKKHFDDVGPQTQVTWERMGWGVEELAEIRGKFSLQIQVLNLLNTNMLRSSHQNVERILMTFIGEIQSGKRESAAISVASTSSLPRDEREAWRTLRKELQSVGVTPDLFMQHRDFILSTIQTHLTETTCETEGFPSLDKSSSNRRGRPIFTCRSAESFRIEELRNNRNQFQVCKAPSPDKFRVLCIGFPNSQAYTGIFDNFGHVILKRSLDPLPSQTDIPHYLVTSKKWQWPPEPKLAELLPDNVQLVVDDFESLNTEDLWNQSPASYLHLHFKNRPPCYSWLNGSRYSISSSSEWSLPNIAVLNVPDATSTSLLEIHSSISAFLQRHWIPAIAVSEAPIPSWLTGSDPEPEGQNSEEIQAMNSRTG